MGTMKQLRLPVACALALMTVAPVEAQVQEIVLHKFILGTGVNAGAGVTLAPDGIYGIATGGGTGNAGVVYKWDTAYYYRVLHNFAGADGAYPGGGVIVDSGNLYGTTEQGGTLGYGVVYKLSAANYTVLYNFTGTDGGEPYTGVIRDSAGNLYGTTSMGGTGGYGVVYKLDAAGNYTVLHNFAEGADGGHPSSGVVRDSATGNLYGTTFDSAGNNGGGVVYKLDAEDNYTVLYRFPKGAVPIGVILAPDGLYGILGDGGAALFGELYKLDASGLYTVLHGFTGGADGGAPNLVIRDSAGNLYGTTGGGGGPMGEGVVYKLDSAGNYTVLYTFTGGADGAQPSAVSRTPAGNLVGTTYSGVNVGEGVMFELTGVQ
jgi:uncharacterized repeat protein (TIGR03803 family)